jgi:predicted amidophosphoribosyltransferase
MTPRYCIKANPDRGENIHTCPICRRETPNNDSACPGCGYKFPMQARRPKLHHDSLISFPRSADSGIGKDLIFL